MVGSGGSAPPGMYFASVTQDARRKGQSEQERILTITSTYKGIKSEDRKKTQKVQQKIRDMEDKSRIHLTI